MLVDHADPCSDRLGGVAEDALRTVDEDRARVWAIEAREDVHEGRLAGAVLTEQAEHLALVYRNGDAVVCQHARKLLRDFTELKTHGRCKPPTSMAAVAVATF